MEHPGVLQNGLFGSWCRSSSTWITWWLAPTVFQGETGLTVAKRTVKYFASSRLVGIIIFCRVQRILARSRQRLAPVKQTNTDELRTQEFVRSGCMGAVEPEKAHR